MGALVDLPVQAVGASRIPRLTFQGPTSSRYRLAMACWAWRRWFRSCTAHAESSSRMVTSPRDGCRPRRSSTDGSVSRGRTASRFCWRRVAEALEDLVRAHPDVARRLVAVVDGWKRPRSCPPPRSCGPAPASRAPRCRPCGTGPGRRSSSPGQAAPRSIRWRARPSDRGRPAACAPAGRRCPRGRRSRPRSYSARLRGSDRGLSGSGRQAGLRIRSRVAGMEPEWQDR